MVSRRPCSHLIGRSTVTLRHSLVPVMFPPCRDPLLRRDTADTHCVYAPNRLAKVVWAPVQNEAPALFRSAPVCTLDPWSGSQC